MNRAFSADGLFLFFKSWALPQAANESAPLALVGRSQSALGLEFLAPTALCQPEPGATPQGS